MDLNSDIKFITKIYESPFHKKVMRLAKWLDRIVLSAAFVMILMWMWGAFTGERYSSLIFSQTVQANLLLYLGFRLAMGWRTVKNSIRRRIYKNF